MTSVFPSVIEEAEGTFSDLKVEEYRSDHVALVEAKSPAAPAGLLTSLLPLRAENAEGEKQPVDLGLEREGDAIAPANPLVSVQIPDALDEGIALPASGIEVALADAPERQASMLSGEAAFYPNIAEDSDLAVIPTPTGFETTTQLRSAQAPTDQTFHLSLPEGAALKATGDGGAIVTVGEEPQLLIQPPSAIDANGEEVPVSLKVDADSITLEAEPSPTSAYPILVDPVFDNYYWSTWNNYTGLYSDWRPYSMNEATFKPTWIGVWNTTMHAGLEIHSYAGASAPGDRAEWFYYVPRYFSDYENPAVKAHPTSYIRYMTLSNLYYLIEEGSPVHEHPYFVAGIWSANKGTWVSAGSHRSSEGPYNGVTIEVPNFSEYTDADQAGVMLATSEYSAYPRQLYVGQASLEVTDQDYPGFGMIGSTGWVNNGLSSQIPYRASDSGLGIYSMVLTQPKASGGTKQETTLANCVGTASSPCPRTVENPSKPLIYNPATMPQGEDWVKVTASDPVGHVSGVAEARVKVDHTAPELSLSGNLTEQGTVGTNLPEYTLNYNTSDGDSTTPAGMTPVGSAGSGSGQLQRPMGVALDAQGNVWVVDQQNNRVEKFGPNGNFISQFGTAGSAAGQLSGPRGIAISPAGNIWVAEVGNKRVQEFGPNGNFIRAITGFSEPYGLACGPNETLWITDSGVGGGVYRYKEDGTKIGSVQPMPGAAPGVAVDAFGNAWVTDQATDKVYEYDSNGRQAFSFGTSGTAEGQLIDPYGIAIAKSGNLLVVDAWGRVQEFKPDGTFMRKFGTAAGSSHLSAPRGIAFGAGNIAYIGDEGTHTIARWSHADLDPQSGVSRVQIYVDGTLEKQDSPGCPTKNCAINGSWKLNANNYSVGTHKVEVFTMDEAGIGTTKTLQVETHGDLTAPTVALSGSITEQESLGKTRPSYLLKVSATDPAPSGQRSSGVASTSVKVDGTTVDSSSPGCTSGGCSITREWTLNSNTYSVGSHSVQVQATDAAGRTTTKTLSINIERDTTAPQIEASTPFYTAPEGWLEQKTYSYNATATDTNGYGVTSLTLKIDGAVVGTSSQTCTAGGCSNSFGSASINLAPYEGGAHVAELLATDGAGNTRKRSWNVNVDPTGAIGAQEAVNTLEAFEDTTEESPLDPNNEQADYEGAVSGLELKDANGSLAIEGSAVPTIIAKQPSEGLTFEIPQPGLFPAACEEDFDSPEEDAAKHSPEVFENEVAEPSSPPCDDGALEGEGSGLAVVEMQPVATAAESTANVSVEGEASVAANTYPSVDTAIRPLYEGAMTFQAIRDSAGPETYSWEVELEPDQEIRQIDSQQAMVYWEGGKHIAFSIKAVPAHDAIGSEVPTQIAVTDGNIVTLTVSHRSSSFVYPVVAGVGWQGGFQTYEVEMPAGEAEGGGEEEGAVEGVSGDGNKVFVRMRAEGPPIASLSSSCDSVGPDFNWCHFTYGKTFNFRECYYEGPDPAIIEPPRVQLINEAIELCKERFGWRRLEAKLSVHGWYRTNTIIAQVWIEQGNLHCDKWGRSQPAKVNCEKRPADWERGVGQPGHIQLFGDYRFWPGDGPSFVQPPGGAGTSACVIVQGQIEYGSGTHSQESGLLPARQGDPCPWP